MTDTSPVHDKLEGVRWVSEYTGLSETGVRRLVRRGTLPHVRINRRILFRPSSIARFIEERESGGNLPARRGRPHRQSSL